MAEALQAIAKGPSILDPTILVSPRHLSVLAQDWKYRYVPSSWAELMEDQDWATAEDVLARLSWPFTRRPIAIRPRVRTRLVEASRSANAYKAVRDDFARLDELYPGLWDFENPLDRVLADEYGFLRRHSSLVARIRRPLYALRDRGIPLLDTGNRLIEAKKRVLAPHGGLKVLLGTLVATQTLFPNPSPDMRILLFLGQEVLLAFDPDPGLATSMAPSAKDARAHR